jgi:hypothetical protein
MPRPRPLRKKTTTSVSLYDDQIDWILENHGNISGFVRDHVESFIRQEVSNITNNEREFLENMYETFADDIKKIVTEKGSIPQETCKDLSTKVLKKFSVALQPSTIKQYFEMRHKGIV